MLTDAYRRTQAIAEKPLAEDYRRLGEITAKLMAAEAHLRAEALRDNQKFWQTLSINTRNAPPELRAQFTALAHWVERESALAALGEGNIDSLVAVNRELMEGLKPATPVMAQTSA